MRGAKKKQDLSGIDDSFLEMVSSGAMSSEDRQGMLGVMGTAKNMDYTLDEFLAVIDQAMADNPDREAYLEFARDNW